MRLLNKAATVLAIGLLAIGATACNDPSEANQKEQASQGQSYKNVVSAQPAERVRYSPARADKNFWIQTWGQNQKNAYVYLLTGDKVYFYVMGGPPTNRCDSLTPPDYDAPGDGYDQFRPAPRVDGVYPMGGTCTTYIGKDATTGGYLEFTLNISTLMLVYSEPQPFPEDILQPLGATKENK